MIRYCQCNCMAASQWKCISFECFSKSSTSACQFPLWVCIYFEYLTHLVCLLFTCVIPHMLRMAHTKISPPQGLNPEQSICMAVPQGGTVYPKKYAHGFVVLCFVVVMQSFIMNSHEVFIHIHQGCFAGTGAIVRLPQCQWSKPGGYGKISQCITTTKHSKAKTVCIFIGIYCTVYAFNIPCIRYFCVWSLDAIMRFP